MSKSEKKIVAVSKKRGVRITVSKKLTDKYRGKILFPEKLAKANEVLSKLKNPIPA